MKFSKLIKKFFIFSLVFAVSMGIFGCSDDDDDDDAFSGSLSLTVNFPADMDGNELTGIIYYSMPTFTPGEDPPEPDKYIDYEIESADEETYTFTFTGVTTASVYVGALLSIDGNSGPNDGDYAEFYDGHGLLDGTADLINLVNGGTQTVEITLDDDDIIDLP